MDRKRTIVTVLAFVLLAAPTLAQSSSLDRKVEEARLVYRELMGEPDRGVPARLLDEAECVAIIPHVIKGAFGWGGRAGKGIFSCRQEGGWSPPIFVRVWGASFGLQIGGQATDLVLFFMTERSSRALLKTKFTLGGDVSVSAGPLGRTAQAVTDITLRAEIYSYAKSRGLFAGIAIDGANLAPHNKSTNRYYGRRLWPEQVLFEGAITDVPEGAQRLLEELP